MKIDNGLAALVSSATADPNQAAAPQPQAGVQQQPQQQVGLAEIQQQIQLIKQQNPQAIEQIKQVIEQALQSGELTPQELNTLTQMAVAVAQSPALWPNLRAYAIKQGLATEQQIPQQYDPGLVFTMLLAAQAAQKDTAQAPAAQQAGVKGAPDMSGGYVIPPHVVAAKGTDFFDKMLAGPQGGAKGGPKNGGL